jgi:ornithine cyclodeaminase
MSRIIELDDILCVLPKIDTVALMEIGFSEYSRGRVVVPPVGELLFNDPPGDVHIKYGYIEADEHFVIKIAGGFYNNPSIGLSSSQGLMLVFSSRTGVLEAVLLDNGHLTNVRTAAAGAVAAKHLAPQEIRGIGILGAGIQAELQLVHVQEVRPCRRVMFWTPKTEEVEPFLKRFADSDFSVEAASAPAEVAAECNLIVTATPSTSPLLMADDIMPGTHITAVGSDTAEKIELDPAILGHADIVVVDSLEQSKTRGEVFRAVSAGAIEANRVRELGEVLDRTSRIRTDDTQISICDLTGVAVQDIQIAKAVLFETDREENR